MAFVTYVLAIFGAALIVSELEETFRNSADSEERAELDSILQFVGGLDSLIHTLIQTLLMDTIHELIRTIMGYVLSSRIFFYTYLATGYLVLMNLVTAIIVDNAFGVTQQDPRMLGCCCATYSFPCRRSS